MKIEDILGTLPTREDIANAIAGQTRNASGDVLSALGIFGAGMLLGAGLAILLTPKTGQELRVELAEAFNGVGHKRGRGGEAADDPPNRPS